MSTSEKTLKILQVFACFLQLLLLSTSSPSVTALRTQRIDRSGWRTIDKGTLVRAGKLVEWDDEDPNDYTEPKELAYDIITAPRGSENSNKEISKFEELTSSIEVASTTTEPPIIEGKPRRPSSIDETWKAVELVTGFLRPTVNDTNNKIARSGSLKELGSSRWWDSIKSKPKRVSAQKPEYKLNEDNKKIKQVESTSVSSSDMPVKIDYEPSWKPLTQATPIEKQERSKDVRSNHEEEDGGLGLRLLAQDDLRWKPLNSDNNIEHTSGNSLQMDEPKGSSTGSIDKRAEEDSIVYGHRVIDYLDDRGSRNINEPFDDDDDGIITARRPRSRDVNKNLGYQMNTTSPDQIPITIDRWIPIESSSMLGSASTVNSTSNSTELTQKASDISYIYSSQPASTDTSDLSSRPQSNVYSYQPNYQVPNTQPINEQVGTEIVDNTSGQTPETIMDRIPEAPSLPIPESNYGYGSYGSYQPQLEASRFNGYGSEQAQAVRQVSISPQTPTRVAIRAASPPSQLVRQEHHYHYYEPQRQSTRSQAITRELSPLIISQPIIQTSSPQSTTTQAPPTQQIIREIVREVPVQSIPIQLPRIISAQPTSLPPIPIVPTPSIAASPARQIIRQISGNMPSVTMRLPQMPQIPQIRLQLPLRLGSSSTQSSNPTPVTRQTGSFVIPPVPRKTTTYLTQTQAMPTHTTIMHTTQYTPATRTTVYTTDHHVETQSYPSSNSYKSRR